MQPCSNRMLRKSHNHKHFFQLFSERTGPLHPYFDTGHVLHLCNASRLAQVLAASGLIPDRDMNLADETSSRGPEGRAPMRNVEIFSTCVFQPRKRDGDRDAHLLFWFIIRQNGTDKLAAIRVFGVSPQEKDRARKSAFQRFNEEYPEFAMVPIVALEEEEPASR